MVCEYVEKCKTCGNRRKWICTASIPQKRILDRAFCLDPVGSECPVYKRVVGGKK